MQQTPTGVVGRESLASLAGKHGTDKATHGFCPFYEEVLSPVRETVRTVVEIGVGAGGSLRMWRDYFPRAVVHGFDCAEVAVADDSRIVLHTGDQADRRDLERLTHALGGPCDLVVDDGGHTMRQQQVTLGFLFAHLRPGGIYVVEDLHTSFMTHVAILGTRDDPGWTYETGALSTRWTTHEILSALAEGRPWSSEHMSRSERQRLGEQIDHVRLFDRDQDRRHMTSILRKRDAATH